MECKLYTHMHVYSLQFLKSIESKSAINIQDV